MRIYIVVIFLLCSFVTSTHLVEDITNKLPDCSGNNLLQLTARILLVSTLDGRLTALNADAGNMLLWSIDTGPGPLLSSSIHKLELTNNGQWVRMIPSLSGGLYKFNGISVESLPIKADHLLQSSSFLLNDGLVISGGRESRIYGIDLGTGETLYECSMEGCAYNNNMSNNVIVIQRHTQTVRAIDMHTGLERWNFSVGQHEVQLPQRVNCHMKDTSETSETTETTDLVPDIEVNAVIPEGIVYASSKLKPEKILWKQKFESPVVAVWKLENGKLNPVDLFHENLWSQATKDSQQLAPVLYIGMHKKQLYIQETSPYSIRLASKLIQNEASETLEVPWHPVPATSTSLALAEIPDYDDSGDNGATTALSVLYGSEYVNGNGYYLFIKDSYSVNQNKQCNPGEETNATGTDTSIDGFDNAATDDTPVNVIVSLWYWWKEVVIISILTAVLVNLIVTQPVLQMVQTGPRNIIQKEIIVIEKAVPAESSSSLSNQASIDGNNADVTEYKSRYLLDFETVQCLGKGGFGVVFEAKNKIDECKYAIKRIQLPNSQESRERVLREVKALAKLDHPHIVRYFNSWIECPPPEWLDNHDSVYCKQCSHIGTMDSVGSNEGSASNSENSLDDKSISFLRIDRESNHSLVHLGTKNQAVTDSDCSFIVFEDSRNEQDEVIPHNGTDNVYVNVEDNVTRKLPDRDTLSQNNPVEYSKSRGNISSSKCSSSEISSCKTLSQPIKMYLYIQMQLCREKSLQAWLHQNTIKRDKFKMLLMFEQILQAVEYIHRIGLIHRDLKPSNIFFSISGQIKVGDFGLVTNMTNNCQNNVREKKFLSPGDEKHTAQVGTQLYMSPEQVEGLPYDYKVDIYSLGLILFELLHPFSTQMERCDTLRALRINQFPETFILHFEHEYRVLSLMLSHDPKERPPSYEIRIRLPTLDRLNFELKTRTDLNSLGF